jgi:hypothetical protein
MKTFILFGHDNGKYAYEKGKSVVCSGCGLINRESSDRNSFNKLKYDFSSTFDNETLISTNLFGIISEFVDSSNFESAGNYYYIFPKTIVEINTEKRQVKYGTRCVTCKTSSHVIGITPCYLTKEITKSGIYATQLCFGDKDDHGANLTPGIIVTDDILNAILLSEVTGLDYELTQR